ncbi:hypothetical protein K501DRAFT_336061 [Backusella circina FSU 941]|nr:hypothetical protein K501DRAFT_336061 [Backusella circina FSU 941]
MTFDFEEKQGDLFDSLSPIDSVALAVSEDLKLGSKGITGAFRQRFSSLLPQLQAQKKTVGQVASLSIQKRFVFYLITRPKTYNKTNLGDIEMCLMELRKACEKHGVYNLALPRELGAGLENLPEKYIKDVLFTVFQGWPGKMIMYQAVE